MKYKDFKNKIRNFPLFSSSQISSITDREQILRNQLTQWQKQGLLFCVKKGLYILNEADRKINPSRLFIAGPEKAIVDFFYLHLSDFHRDDKDIFSFSYRFQNVSDLNKKRFKDFAKTFGNRKLLKIVNLFCEFIESRE